MSITNAEPTIISNIPTLPLRGIAVFPGSLFQFDVGRVRSVNALKTAMERGQQVFLVAQKDMRVDDPKQDDLYQVGVFCKIRQILRAPGDNTIRVLVEGEKRAAILRMSSPENMLLCDISLIQSEACIATTKRDQALLRNLQAAFGAYAEVAPRMIGEIIISIMGDDDLSHICDYIAQNIQLSYQDKQTVLEELNPRKRAMLLTKLLTREAEIISIENNIQENVKEQMDKNQHDYYLREQIKAINDELGEGDDPLSEAAAFNEKIKASTMPASHKEKLLREATKLSRMQSSSPETSVIRSYLDTCLEIPWNVIKPENNDIGKAARILDADHFGLKKVKDRILEFFAVKNLTGSVSGQIICLVGPPGVGKTSVARSIARCMGRDYARLSLGGVRDEADIRGHRKTYIGAMPGRIINALIQAKSSNCLILIDEIDKLGSDYKGDPSAALLEVFDSEQNSAFRDHFVELPVDLSHVLFLTTANTMDTIPEPLRDRMEIIELPSYTDEEKLEIAKHYIFPKQLKKHGLKPANLRLSPDAIRFLISRYTRESGVRTLERELAKLCRKTAKYMNETGSKSLTITPKNIATYMGTPIYRDDEPQQLTEPGVVNGLAWTSVGGEKLEVEAMAVTGTGKLELTGNLGDVMKESAKAALTYIRSRSESLNLPVDFASTRDIHIHFPEGAVPKDGPSAGIATATALISALKNIPVPKDIAMTGEITLRGRVLPIGGLREKTMAALRNKITTVIIPQDNMPDLDDIDQKVREQLTFVPVSHMDQVTALLFSSANTKVQSPAVISMSAVLMPQEKPSGSIRQ